MGIKEWYKNTMEDDVARLEKKYVILLMVSLSGILAALKKDEKIYRLALIVTDFILIIDTLVDIVFSLHKQKREDTK